MNQFFYFFFFCEGITGYMSLASCTTCL